MANGGEHVACVGVVGWLARRTRRPKSFSSQVAEAVIPCRISRDRGFELRRAALVLVDDGFVTFRRCPLKHDVISPTILTPNPQPTAVGLVLSRRFDLVDDQHGFGSQLRIKFQTELFL